MTCKRDTNGNIIGWDRQSITDSSLTPTGIILGPILNLASIRAHAVRLKTPIECLHVCKMADTGDWELFYKPGITPGAGYTDNAILPKPEPETDNA